MLAAGYIHRQLAPIIIHDILVKARAVIPTAHLLEDVDTMMCEYAKTRKNSSRIFINKKNSNLRSKSLSFSFKSVFYGMDITYLRTTVRCLRLEVRWNSFPVQTSAVQQVQSEVRGTFYRGAFAFAAFRTDAEV